LKTSKWFPNPKLQIDAASVFQRLFSKKENFDKHPCRHLQSTYNNSQWHSRETNSRRCASCLQPYLKTCVPRQFLCVLPIFWNMRDTYAGNNNCFQP